ncbi:MAG TPA: hypothetical protein VH330_06100 [Candidatus Udaeobacter sp.]|jgi:hypothetical protein
MLFILFLDMLLPCSGHGKRAGPAKVEPVIDNGIRYVAPNDDGRRGYIEAWDVKTNKKLWDLTVFTNRVDPKLEEDVQWVFINKLAIHDNTLVVTSERDDTHLVDVNTKAITQSNVTALPEPDAPAGLKDVPEVIKRAITNGLPEYELSFRAKPFYLRGDFNGDGKTDVAAVIKQRSTGKRGIAIIRGGTEKVTILGAGTSIGNGGDDFEWMDSWEVYSRDRAAHSIRVPKLHGDALLVSKSETGSALIYWNGKRYVWLQQGD